MIGALLFYLQGKLFPEPKPVIGPLGEARIEALQQQWFASVGRLPTSIEVNEIAGQQYHMVWKTPVQATSNIPLMPEWPESCEITQATPSQVEGSGKVSSL